MRIAWIVPGFQGRADEPGIPALTALACELAREHDLTVYSVRFPPRHERYVVAGVPVASFGAAPCTGERVGNRFRGRAATVARWGRVLSALHAAHQRAPLDLLHGFWATEPGMLAVLVGRLLGVPATVSVCGGELASVRPVGYGNRLQRLERGQIAGTLHLAQAIGVGSEDTRARLAARYPWLSSRIRDLPLGFDPAIFTPLATPSLDGTIVCIASWTPVKDHGLLLAAMRLLQERRPEARLVLVGERTDSEPARAIIAAHGLADCVESRGYLPQDEVAALLARARLSVITSWHEAQCLAVVEPLARGVPVVATPVGIARTLLRDATLGSLVPSRSPEVLAQVLEQVWDRAANEPASARAARATAVAHLALPRVAAHFIDQYQAMSQDRGIRQ